MTQARNNKPERRVSAKMTAKRSTARNVAKSAKGWSGDDLDEVMKIVADTRSKSRF